MKRFLTRSDIRLGSYTVLLLALLGHIVLQSSLQENGTSVRWIPAILFPLILFTTLSSAVEGRRQLVLLIGFFLVFSFVDAAEASTEGDALVPWSYVGHFLFLLWTVVVVLRHVFRDAAIRADMVVGSVCAFLLLGLAFNEIFGLLETLNPGSFRGGRDIRADGGYFSLVTLTTLGYGDVVPVKAVARSLAAIQAVVGQFYIAVIVARLVALRMQYAPPKRSAQEG